MRVTIYTSKKNTANPVVLSVDGAVLVASSPSEYRITLTAPKKPTNSKTTSSEASAVIKQIQDSLRERFATEVKLKHRPKKGKIEISYYGNDDLQRILDLLGIQL